MGGSGSLALGIGVSATGTLQLAAFPDGTVAIVASGSYNPGNIAPALGMGAVGGAAVSYSTAQTPSQLESQSASVAGGYGSVQVSESFSATSATTTVIVGPGIAGRGKGTLKGESLWRTGGAVAVPSWAQKPAFGAETGGTKVLASFNCRQAALEALINSVLSLFGSK